MEKNSMDITFKQLGQVLVKTLEDKNRAYGNSFDKSIETYGHTAFGVRASDKYNRIEHLIVNAKDKENDESIMDTELDLAGYCLLDLANRIKTGKAPLDWVNKYLGDVKTETGTSTNLPVKNDELETTISLKN